MQDRKIMDKKELKFNNSGPPLIIHGVPKIIEPDWKRICDFIRGYLAAKGMSEEIEQAINGDPVFNIGRAEVREV